jgi:hypothetical protein
LAFKFRKFIIGGEHKMLSWRLSNRCALNHGRAPLGASHTIATREQALGSD